MKPANVLLKSSNNDPRGFTVKVSDFGLSRCVEEEEHCEATPMQFAMHSHVPHIQWYWTPVPSDFTKALLLSPQCLLSHIQSLKGQYLIPYRPPVYVCRVEDDDTSSSFPFNSCGTAAYVAPEALICNKKVNSSVDVSF